VASLFVAAIVVSHAQADHLERALLALKSQSHPISQIVVVETAGDQDSISVAKALGIGVISPGNLRLGAAVEAGIQALQVKPGWLWILHEDCIPNADALQMLARAAEISPSVAIIGPKLLKLESPIQIQQMGLTVTSTGRPFLQVQDEYDQGQHDNSGDSLAVSTAGMLVSKAAWDLLGGLDDSSPTLAQDLELGIKARSAGFRVVVEPSAVVVHAGLSLAGKRSRGWMQGRVQSARSKAHIHLATLIFPWWLVVLGYLSLPLVAFASIPFHLLAKRPTRILGQFSAWSWAWLTAGKRFAAKQRLSKIGKTAGLRPLFASRKQVKRRRLAGLDQEPILEAGSRTSLFSSNSGWLGLLPLIAAFQLFPVGAIRSTNFLPLSSTFSQVWNSVSIAPGSIDGAPSDPFVWFYALLGSFSPQDPSRALSTFVFLSPALVFFGTWQLLSIFITRVWVRNLSALATSLGPILLTTALQGGVVEVTAMVFTPWTLFFLIRAALAYNSARSWRWVGLGSLSLAILTISSPISAAIVLLVILGLSALKPKKALILVWAVLPSVALYFPWASWAIGTGQLELLTLGGSGALAASKVHDELAIQIGLGLALALAIFGIFRVKLGLALTLSIISVVTFGASFVQFYSSSRPVLAFSFLALVALAGLGLDSLSGKGAILPLAGILALLTLASGAVYGLAAESRVSFQSDQLMPALVNAAADSSLDVKTLLLVPGDPLQAKIVYGNGLSQNERSFLAELNPQGHSQDAAIAQLAGNLVSGNSTGIQDLLQATGVEFILLDLQDSAQASQIRVSIDAMAEFQAAGETGFGALWRAVNPATPKALPLADSSTRDWQAIVLAVFALLAIPTPNSIRGYRKVKSGEI
jgi:GT2 family glycosyltransferase